MIQSSILLICVLIRCPDWQGHKSWLMRVTFQSWCNKCIQNQSAQQFEIPKKCFFKVISHVPPSFSSIHIACPTLGWPFLPPHLHIFLRQSPLFWATHWALVILTNYSHRDSTTKRLGKLRAISMWFFTGQFGQKKRTSKTVPWLCLEWIKANK